MSKILIVEDEEAQRLLYETEIAAEGYEVVLARDGVDAIEKVRENEPDVIVLDLMMPNMHGLDAMRKLLKINPNMPVIIHTAYDHYKDNFLSWAAQEYVVKSSDLSSLKQAIRRALAGDLVSA
ncbi:MAG: response regulator [Calditrichia bacterium]